MKFVWALEVEQWGTSRVVCAETVVKKRSSSVEQTFQKSYPTVSA